MGLLIDTSALVDLERAGAPPEGLGELTQEPTFLAAITASELLHGVHRADTPTRRARRLAFVEAILDVIPTLPFDLTAARVHAGLWAELRERGALIGAHDLQIAATALARGLGVLTRNEREFGRVDGLRVEVWGR